MATPVISVKNITLGESDPTPFFTVQLSESSTTVITVNWSLSQMSAANGTDFIASSGKLTFDPGVTELLLPLTILNDIVAETSESFLLNLFTPSANSLIGNTSATATIIDNDAASGTPIVAINDFVIDEAAKEATFVITLDRPATGVVSMHYATQNGAALAGSDFVAASGTLTFAPGETAKTVTVTLLNDTAFEASEAFNLVLSKLSGATSLDPVGTAIIAENDAPAVSNSNISVADIVVGESQTYADFLVRLDAPNSNTVTVNYQTNNGTAIFNSDGIDTSGSLTFAAGEMVKTLRVTLVNDATVEATENFSLQLFNPSANATIARNIATATIIDNDAASGTPVVAINDFVIDEAAKEATFVITLDRPATGVVSMHYTTQNGAALAGSDFVAASGTLTFAPGETAKTVTVTLLNDTAFEASEAFNLVLSKLSGATSLDPVGTAIIAENDAPAVSNSNISVADIVVGESQTYADFLVRLDAPNSNTVTVNYQTNNGTAIFNSDGIDTSGSLTFAAGEMVKTLRVTLVNDATVEATENFSLQLFNPSANATIARNIATATIIDNDAASGTPVVAINDFVIDEAAKEATFVITLDRPATGVVSMHYTTQNGAALAGSDFVAASGTLTFAPGETAKTVTVTLLNDTAFEASEAFNLVLSKLSGATSLDPAGTAIIAENDAPAVSNSNISVADIVVGESQTYADFLVRLDAPNSNTVTVNYQTNNGTAIFNSDGIDTSGSLTFAAGEMVKTLRVTLVNDATVEATENFSLQLFNPSANTTIARNIAIATIIDNDATSGTPVIKLGDAVIDEKDGLAFMTISLDKPSVNGVIANYTLQNVTASKGTDYINFPSQTVSFAPGETAKQIAVGILNDSVTETIEVFNVALTGVNGATTGEDGLSHIAIWKNDTSVVNNSTINVTHVSAVENQGYVDFLIHLNAPNTGKITVNYQTNNGTAIFNSDGIDTSGTLTFAAGEMVKTVRVALVNDVLSESIENFQFQLFNPSVNATLGNAIATATIIDDDSAAPASPVTLVGTAEADVLRGTPYVDALIASAGDDLLIGGANTDNMIGGTGNDAYIVDNTGDTVIENANEGTDTIQSSVTYTLSSNVENLVLTGNAAINGTGNTLNNIITGNVAANKLNGAGGADILTGGLGNDTITGGNGKDVLIGSLGKDTLILNETSAASDVVKIAKGDSPSGNFDVVTGFQLGLSDISSAGTDKLDLPDTLIAANTLAVDGVNAGVIKSHQISNGLISFDDSNNFTTALALKSGQLADVFNYLQTNIITEGATAAFNAGSNAYVFQEGKDADSLVQLTGINIGSISDSGMAINALWIA